MLLSSQSSTLCQLSGHHGQNCQCIAELPKVGPAGQIWPSTFFLALQGVPEGDRGNIILSVLMQLDYIQDSNFLILRNIDENTLTQDLIHCYLLVTFLNDRCQVTFFGPSPFLMFGPLRSGSKSLGIPDVLAPISWVSLMFQLPGTGEWLSSCFRDLQAMVMPPSGILYIKTNH